MQCGLQRISVPAMTNTQLATLSMDDMREAAKARPPGYLEHCVSVGTLSEDGETLTFTRDVYDDLVKAYRWTSPGPGYELGKLLKRFGIEQTEQCPCRSMAAKMNAWGADECEKPERIAEVLAVMREEAAKRGLPFFDFAGRLLIRRAIANARRAAKV